MVEVGKSGFFSDFFFQFMNGAGSIDGFDRATVGADEIVAVLVGKEKCKVSGALMKAKAADHAFAAESLEKSKDGCFITLLGKVTTGSELGQRHGPVVLGEAGEDSFESLGAAEPGILGCFEELIV